MSEATDSVALREPAHRVSPRAVTYWRVSALLGAVIEVAIVVGVYVFGVPSVFDDQPRPRWTTALPVVTVVGTLAHLIVMPPLRYRIHRWEITPTAIHTRRLAEHRQPGRATEPGADRRLHPGAR
ncbi:PH domain-containing protein [Nocardioides sp. B-3]|uniref:PH domain-containing protein n=1 Tax=Nocardioides sp. B-3 TaxID=2895565 RepID=UPI0021524E70|nr:hypothetical protein [Nocardioides sp. B-3]UUZ60220.1 hypothetical protein LP418_04580 [Nocardioides sp. B-3]